MTLPPLTLNVCTYKRPWYAVPTISALIHRVHYDGQKRFHIADGGSPQEDLDYYARVLEGCDYSITVTDNLADMMNSCAAASGEVWFVTLDDFKPRRIDVTPDVKFLLANEDVGAVRMGRLAFFEHMPDMSPEDRLAHQNGSYSKRPPEDRVYGELRMEGGLHWWAIDKEKTTHPYICSINTTVYHRRFWDTYGNIESCPPNLPGEAELHGASRYNDNPSRLTIAIPVRFGEDWGDYYLEPIEHYGMWRTDEYTAAGGGRRI